MGSWNKRGGLEKTQELAIWVGWSFGTQEYIVLQTFVRWPSFLVTKVSELGIFEGLTYKKGKLRIFWWE